MNFTSYVSKPKYYRGLKQQELSEYKVQGPQQNYIFFSSWILTNLRLLLAYLLSICVEARV